MVLRDLDRKTLRCGLLVEHSSLCRWAGIGRAQRKVFPKRIANHHADGLSAERGDLIELSAHGRSDAHSNRLIFATHGVNERCAK